jgi:hypothetical protein
MKSAQNNKIAKLRPAIRHVGEKFAGRKTDLCGAEIGVWKGDHAERILRTLEPRMLLLVDRWAADDPGGHYAQYIMRHRGKAAHDRWIQTDWQGMYESVLRRFESRGGQVVTHRADSMYADAVCVDDSLDFAYIDGGHDYLSVSIDLDVWWPKVRSGGVIAGHDYDEAKHPDVFAAVNDFADRIGAVVSGDESDWWIDKFEELLQGGGA